MLHEQEAQPYPHKEHESHNKTSCNSLRSGFDKPPLDRVQNGTKQQYTKKLPKQTQIKGKKKQMNQTQSPHEEIRPT